MPKESWLNSWQQQEIFLFFQTSRLALSPTQPPTEWISGSLSFKVKSPGCETEIHFHLMPWLTVNAPTPLLHPNAFAACRMTHLIFPGWHSRYNNLTAQSGVRILVGARNVSLLQNVLMDCWCPSSSYSMGMGVLSQG